MYDALTLLASLSPKTAIKEGKLDFLMKRYEPKLKDYVLAAGLVELLNEDDPDQGAEFKKNNEAALKSQYKRIIEEVAKADPTDAQNKNDATEWLLKLWLGMDGPHKARWAEDTPAISELLAEFNDIKKLPEFKDAGGESDLNKYEDIQAIRNVVNRFSHADARFALPELSETGAIVIYKDKHYILWQVTSAEDLVALSSFPPNNPPAWCTKALGTAQGYISTGPEYVAYKDGDPLFQIDPHDKSGKPQFMSRHNTKMHSSKMMNNEAAEMLTRAMAGGMLNEQAEKDLGYVMSVYKAPNLNDADTFEYLKEYVLVNGSNARKDPRFLEIEQSYVKPRFLIMEPDELRQLTNRYGRTGEATKDMIDENRFTSRLAAKIDTLPSFIAFKALGPNGAKSNTIDKIESVEYGLCFRLDGLFKKVFALFDKEFGFSEKYKALKDAVKAKDAAKVGEIGLKLIGILKAQFPGPDEPSGYDSDRIHGFEIHTMTEHYGEQSNSLTPRDPVRPYIRVIEQQIKPFLKDGLSGIYNAIDANTESGKAAANEIQAAHQNAVAQVTDRTLRTELDNLRLHALKTVAGAKLGLQLARFNKVKDIREFLTQEFKAEMRGRRWPYNTSFSEDKLPGWARDAYNQRLQELESAKEQAREQKKVDEEGREKRTRWSPKQEYQNWSATHGPETPDPESRTIKFVLSSPSYDNDDKMGFLTDMKEVHPEGEEWVIQNARNVGDLFRYLRKHHPSRWPELEQAYEHIIHTDEYQEMAYKDQRIPGREDYLLRRVRANDNLDEQMAYINKHLKGARWPELEQKIETTFNAADWNRYGAPELLALSILEYMSKFFKPGERWKAIEDKMFENDEYGLKYVFHLLPDAKQRIRKLLEQEHTEDLLGGEKKSSSLNTRIIARFRKELETL